MFNFTTSMSLISFQTSATPFAFLLSEYIFNLNAFLLIHAHWNGPEETALGGGTLYYNTFRKPACVGRHHSSGKRRSGDILSAEELSW